MEDKVYLDDKIYDNFYTFYYDEMIISVPYYEELISLVRHHLYEGLILCLNSRNGHLVQLLPNSVGLDNSKSMIKMAKYKYPDNIYVLGSPLKKATFQENKFTHIICPLLTIHTIKDINQLFNNVSDWLVHTGIFIICVADIDTFPLYKMVNHNPSPCFSSNYNYSTEISNHTLIEKITDVNYKTRKNIQTLYNYDEKTIISKCKPYGLHVKETYKMSIPFTVIVFQKKSI
jgi:SAM-dependent methyltransferase